MGELVLDAATRKRVIDRLAWTLKTFHETDQKNKEGYESVSWRGQLGGFRRALGIIIGKGATEEILETVRQQTRLGFPHAGPVTDDGEIYNIDPEAQPGL